MKKAVVAGGSNGIGLAIVNRLILMGYDVLILDRVRPDEQFGLDESRCTYLYCDLSDTDTSLFEQLCQEEEIELLMLTAGFGRVCALEHLHPAEIQKLMQVNTVSCLKIIRCFYERIKSDKKFYCGIMGSVAGLMSSPLFSVYAASKAAICRFVESVNIELEVSGTSNRILNVSPASVEGTRFNGGRNEITKIDKLAEQILQKLLAGEELYIPRYEESIKGILERYQHDPHAYGLHSYAYKKRSGREVGESRAVIGYLSGTFDLFHVGHLNLLKRAKAKCDYLIVGVHPNASHKMKEAFVPFEERKAMVASCRYVDKVVEACPEDADAWPLYGYHRLFVGSDYQGSERFERYEAYFRDKPVEIIYFPYTQGTSSTQIRNALLNA